MSGINTNVASLNAQRNLMASQSSLQTSIQRLSSGLRVNSAKDDAAGLSIADRMNTQVRGLTVAARNASDGISLSQTAEGALGKVGDMLQRMRELAVQSSNATNTQSDRNSLDSEVTQLKAEINRVATQTSFNGVKLLDGSFSGANFQVGANAGETISVASITNAQTAQLGGTVNIATTSAAASGISGFATAIVAGDVLINGVDIAPAGISAAGSALERAGQMVNAINLVSGQTNVGASYDAATGQITLRSSTGAIATTGALNDATVAGFDNTTGTAAAAATTGITGLNVQSYSNSQLALTQIDAALSQVNTARGNLGAIQGRFENAIDSINVTSENVTTARGRIVDADFAKESANLARAQVLQQAGTAMVAQANALPNGVMQLLRG
ncbi:MAG: flagellin [Usitatibacteraceae bacterium]